MNRPIKVFLLLSVLGLVFLQGLKADVTGSIFGDVKDASGGVLPSAAVTATNVSTGLIRSTQSDASGYYQMLSLPVGNYKVEGSIAGFQKFVSTGIDLTVNEQRRVDIVMQVGGVGQRVEVSAAALQVETASTQLGQVIEEKQLLALPLNGRAYTDLLGLQAGVVPVSSGNIWQARPVSGELNAGNLSVSGQRESANAFLVNGGDVSEGRTMGAAVIPNLDSVAEFRLITNSFDAEYGRFSGAIMNAITKSGTNGFHGSAFEFLRNDDLDSRGFFDPTRGAFKRNQFGYAVGGPAIKNKIFWFTDYQGTREVQGLSTGFLTVPTADMRSGNFASLNAFVDSTGNPTAVNGPYWAQVLSQRLGYTVTNGEPYSPANCTSTLNCVFPGGVIPQRGFAPTAIPLMKYIPLPNTGSDTFTTAGQNLTLTDDKAAQRVDVLNDKKTGNWYIYYSFDDTTTKNPFVYDGLPGFPGLTPARVQQAVLSNTKVLGPTAVNEARLSFTRFSATINEAVGGRGAKLSDLGFITNTGLGIFPYPQYEGVPDVDFNNFSIGNAAARRQANNTWHASENFSKIYGQHTLKFGGEFRYLQVNGRNVANDINGDLGFNGSQTGSDFADFLLGAAAYYTQSSVQYVDSRTRYGAVYGQDSFRIKPNLTLNYGLRWEASMPWYDTQNRIETIVPGVQSIEFPTAPKGWLVPGDPGIPRTLAPTDYKDFGPRIGLAYSPNSSGGLLGKIVGGPGKTSIRAAYGVYYTAIEDGTSFSEIADAPFGMFWVSSQPVLAQEPFRSLADGSSQGLHFPFFFPIPGSPANKALDYSIYLPISGSPGYWYKNLQPYAEHYNFTLQRALSSSMVMSLAYVGTQGHRLLTEVEANPGNPNLCLSLRGSGVMPGTAQCGPFGENATYTRPDGSLVVGTRGPLGNDFGSNPYNINLANSNYNSFQATLERRAANFTFLAAYTFSKSIDDASGFVLGNNWTNFSNYRLSRALSDFDMTHNFVVSYNYALPLDRGLSSVPKRMTQGWGLSGITRFATGLPVTIYQTGDRSLVGSGNTDVPNFVGPLVTQDPRLPGSTGKADEFFGKSAFDSGPLGGFGDANRRFFHGPGLNNWDVALYKDTRISERMALQFRAEFFNLFNHAQFNNPNGNFSSSLFGYVTSARAPRIGQMSLKLHW
jgi:hypothetical protein